MVALFKRLLNRYFVGGVIQMKLADLSTGPDWGVYVGFIILAVLSIVLISGHGSWLISGYNTASKEEKAKYNEKNYAEQWELECLL